jgi:hypothetical protein
MLKISHCHVGKINVIIISSMLEFDPKTRGFKCDRSNPLPHSAIIDVQLVLVNNERDKLDLLKLDFYISVLGYLVPVDECAF